MMKCYISLNLLQLPNSSTSWPKSENTFIRTPVEYFKCAVCNTLEFNDLIVELKGVFSSAL